MTSRTIFTIGTFATVGKKFWSITFLTTYEMIWLCTIDTIIGVFTIIYMQAINRIFGMLDNRAIHTVLTEIAIKNQIAIFGISTSIYIFTILIHFGNQWEMWNLMHQFIKLLEEWSCKIHFFPKIQRVPTIRSSCLLFVDCICLVRWIYGNDLFASCITSSTIEFPIVTKRQSSFLSFFWTKRWRRNTIFLPSNHWRNFIIKLNIWLINRKLLPTYFANFPFNDRIINFVWNELINLLFHMLYDTNKIYTKISNTFLSNLSLYLTSWCLIGNGNQYFL